MRKVNTYTQQTPQYIGEYTFFCHKKLVYKKLVLRWPKFYETLVLNLVPIPQKESTPTYLGHGTGCRNRGTFDAILFCVNYQLHTYYKLSNSLYSQNEFNVINQNEILQKTSKMKWLVILRILEINGKLKLVWVKNVVLRQFLASRSRLRGAKLS